MKVYFDRPTTEEIPDLAILLHPGFNEVSDEQGKILLARKQVRLHKHEDEDEKPHAHKKGKE
jgi:hypothetical protein